MRPPVRPTHSLSSSEATGANDTDTHVGGGHDHDDDVQKPKPLPAPTLPTPEEILEHNLTHIPYRPWCRYCVMSRRPNDPHKSRFLKRTVPLLVGDYCFIRSSTDEILQTVLVVRMYPFRLLMAIHVDSKGATDEYTINRLCEFVKSTGVKHLVYLSDQEASLRTTFEEAIKRLAADGELTQACLRRAPLARANPMASLSALFKHSQT